MTKVKIQSDATTAKKNCKKFKKVPFRRKLFKPIYSNSKKVLIGILLKV